MDALIDKSYFTLSKQIYISNLNGDDSEREDLLNELIVEYQDEFIKRAFGDNLTEAQIETLKPYFIFDDKKKSPLANYVYCIFMENDAQRTTNAGVKNLAISNTTEADYRIKVVKAWNNMVIMLNDIHNVLYKASTMGTGEGAINYLNDISSYVSAETEFIERANGSVGVYLEYGIFQPKTIYDYNK